jgi:hypothetical protein
MALVGSLLNAIVRADGDALVMHVGEKPYVVASAGPIELSSQGLNLQAMTGMTAQLLPADAQRALSEFGAVEHELPSRPEMQGDRFTVVVARGGDDVWIEIRRHRRPRVAVAPENVAPAAAPENVAPAASSPEPPAAAPSPAVEEPATEVIHAEAALALAPEPEPEPEPVPAAAPTPEPVAVLTPVAAPVEMLAEEAKEPLLEEPAQASVEEPAAEPAEEQVEAVAAAEAVQYVSDPEPEVATIAAASAAP